MKRLIAAGLVAGGLAGCGGTPIEPVGRADAGPNPAPSVVTMVNLVSPLSGTTFVPCANGGAGEEVLLSGQLHETLHVTLNANGNSQIRLHFQPQGAKGTGLITGDDYNATGVTQETVTAKKGASSTFVNNVAFIGSGPDNNFYLKRNIHLTIDADGTVTAEHDTERVECR